MKITHLVLIGFVLTLNGCKRIADKEIIVENETSSLLFKQVSIFNGKDSILITDKDVLIKDGVIHEISDRIEAIENYQIVEGKGKTLMPGLIDSHVHLSGSGSVPWENYSANEAYNLSAYLYAGITTVYDLGGLANSISELAEKVDKGELIGPSIYNTHIPITVKNSHPIPLTKMMMPWPLKSLVNTISPTIDEVSEAPDLMEDYVSKNIDYVKISCDQIPEGTPEMTFEQMKALITEAHKHNQKVFVHIGSPENAVNAVKAGADILAHGVWRGELSPEQADIIAKSKIPIIYTIAGFNNVSAIYEGKFKPNTLDRALVDAKVLDPVSEENGHDVHQHKVMDEFFKNAKENRQYWKSNFRMLYEKRAVIVVGTDSNLPGTYAGSTYFQEMDLLKEYGLSNFEILRGATYLNSKLFLYNPDFGTIEVGKKANLLLVNGNPLLDLEKLQNPEFIVNRGNIVERVK
jgi:imidazolonepropionase-like amidohydrolase